MKHILTLKNIYYLITIIVSIFILLNKDSYGSNKLKARSCLQGCHQRLTEIKHSLNSNNKCKSCHSHNDNHNDIKTISNTLSYSEKKANLDDMALIPAGNFIFGTNDRFDDEGPAQTVYIDEYHIDLYEVSNTKYKEFTDQTSYKKPFHWRKGKIPQGKEQYPVIYVNWFDADNYCRWRGKRLPTETEWEKGARGPNGRNFPYGNLFDKTKSNNPQKGSKGIEPVDSYEDGRSYYGLYNMSGNVWEWVDDWYLPHPGNKVPKLDYGKNKRILKGGSWFDCLSYGCGLSAPSYNRSYFVPKVRNHSFGFRCA